jgi:hypothetical protein
VSPESDFVAAATAEGKSDSGAPGSRSKNDDTTHAGFLS